MMEPDDALRPTQIETFALSLTKLDLDSTNIV